MKRLLNLHRFLVLVVILFATMARADDLISKAAWRRPLGLALENPAPRAFTATSMTGTGRARQSAVSDLALFRGAIAAILRAGI